MWETATHDSWVEEIFLAGQTVRPGIYQQVGGARRIHLEREDVLPASLDGQVACYNRVRHTWAQIAEASHGYA